MVDPYGSMTPRNAQRLHDQAMVSDQVAHVRYLIGEHLAELEDSDDLTHDFTRGYRMALRVAWLVAGGQCDGSEDDWSRVVAAHRRGTYPQP